MKYQVPVFVVIAIAMSGCASNPTPPQPATAISPPVLPSPTLPQTVASAEMAPIQATPPSPRTAAPVETTPIQAILAAAEKPEGITGVFRLEVKGAGRQDGWLYLNSETDYRDQRCLTVALTPPAAKEFEVTLGEDPVGAARGKSIRVVGTAQRATVWFYSNGVRTDKYYYQTQIRVRDISQIRVVP